MNRPDPPQNQYGVASLILGISALVTSWALIGIVLGVVAVLTGDIGRRRVARGEATNPRAAIAGIVLGALAIVAGIIAVGYYAWREAHNG